MLVVVFVWSLADAQRLQVEAGDLAPSVFQADNM